jgi:hypothetical protein
MEIDDDHKKKLNDHWRDLVSSGDWEIDVADDLSRLIDDDWKPSDHWYTTRWNATRWNMPAQPLDYELTVVRVAFHILRRLENTNVHERYVVDSYQMHPVD